MPKSENGLYVLSPGGSTDEADGWVRPRLVTTAIVETVTDATDLDADDIGDVDQYVDTDDIVALLDDRSADADESVTFTVEGHEVTVDGTGHVAIES